MTRVIGAPKSRRRRWTFLWCLIAVVGLGVVFIPGALAVHDEGVFQLEGNALHTGDVIGTNANPQSTLGAAHDWDQVYADVTNSTTTSGAEAMAFVTDGFGAGDSILNGGATKDINDLQPSWLWKQTATTSVQDKDDIEHAFAAQYSVDKNPGNCGTLLNQDPCVLLYFGADRFSNSGDAVMGFWFFKSKITKSALDANGNGTFIGHHTARTTDSQGHILTRGDILVVSDFRAGGKAPSIQVYEWVDSGGSASTHLDRIGGSDNPAGCTQSPPEQKNGTPVPPVSANDNFCATANQFVVTSPWAFTPKANSGGTAGAGGTAKFGVAEFMEGGINMTALGLGNECFSTFLAETRSSHSVTSTLSDFALGGFGSCGATFATQTSDTELNIGDTAPTDTATISVSGAGGSPPAPEGNVDFYLCGPSTSSISVCNPGANDSPFDTEDLANATASGTDYSIDSTAPTITSAGYYCFAARWAGDDNYTDGPYADDGTNECFHVSPLTPDISTSSDVGPVDPGTVMTDDATLSGTATPSNGTDGTITWKAYGPDDATCATVIYTSVIDITGDGTYNSGDGDGGDFAPTDPGTYRWRAFYDPDSGDVNNVAVSTPCNDDNESFVVQQFNPALTTAQTWTVKDTATITVDGGGNLKGTAHFGLFDNATCDGTALYTEDVAVDGASGVTASTTPYELTASADTLYWQVSYTSDNGAQTDIDATCVENSSLTVDNGS